MCGMHRVLESEEERSWQRVEMKKVRQINMGCIREKEVTECWQFILNNMLGQAASEEIWAGWNMISFTSFEDESGSIGESLLKNRSIPSALSKCSKVLFQSHLHFSPVRPLFGTARPSGGHCIYTGYLDQTWIKSFTLSSLQTHHLPPTLPH